MFGGLNVRIVRLGVVVFLGGLRVRAGLRSALKRVHSRRNLRVRTSDAMDKARPSRLRPLTLRFLSAPVHALV